MKTYNVSVIIFLLAICIIAIALGYAGSKNIPAESATFVNVNASSSGLVIPQHLLNSEVENILLEVDQEYPDSIIIADKDVTLVGTEATNKFKQSISENNIDFDMDAVYSFYNLDTSAVLVDSYIVYSPASPAPYNSVTITYAELENLLNGDNDTVSYYRDLLNNSQYTLYPAENPSVFMIRQGSFELVNSSNQVNGMAVVTISTTGE